MNDDEITRCSCGGSYTAEDTTCPWCSAKVPHSRNLSVGTPVWDDDLRSFSLDKPSPILKEYVEKVLKEGASKFEIFKDPSLGEAMKLYEQGKRVPVYPDDFPDPASRRDYPF